MSSIQPTSWEKRKAEVRKHRAQLKAMKDMKPEHITIQNLEVNGRKYKLTSKYVFVKSGKGWRLTQHEPKEFLKMHRDIEQS